MGNKEDNAELNEKLKGDDPMSNTSHSKKFRDKSVGSLSIKEPKENKEVSFDVCQWTTGDNKVFIPAMRSTGRLAPALYEIKQAPNIGIYFEKVQMANEGLIRFPDSNSDLVINEIKKFWEREGIFAQHNFTFKRGILLWGPPGSGKTCTVKLLISDLIQKREGVVLKFTEPGLFAAGMRIFRTIQPKTPIIVLMEDLDSILDDYSESEVINILDGVDRIEKVVFLATTNYPERLGARIVNRPSRFDKRFKIGMPSPEARRTYLEFITQKSPVDLDKWVRDTNGFSIAHLKELFVSVNILGDDYEEAIKVLSSMKASLTSSHDGGKMGL